MARLYTEGFEGGDLKFFDISAGSLESGATYIRSGSYCLKAQGISYKNIDNVNDFYIRFSIKTGNTNELFSWRYNTTTLGRIKLEPTKKLGMYVGNTLVALGNLVLSNVDLEHYLVEAHIRIADNPDGLIELKVDGILDTGKFVGDTKPDANTDVNNIGFGFPNTTVYMDDIAMDDSFWCGDGKIIALRPNGDGNFIQLSGSDGNSVNNYLLVDDTIPDSDVTYVEGYLSDTRDLYHIEPFTATRTSINRIYVESRSRDTTAEGGSIALGILPSGGSEDYSPDRYLYTSYTQIKGSEYVTNPVTATGWTSSDLEGLQIAVKTR